VVDVQTASSWEGAPVSLSSFDFQTGSTRLDRPHPRHRTPPPHLLHPTAVAAVASSESSEEREVEGGIESVGGTK
jgi:hypothetical protein